MKKAVALLLSLVFVLTLCPVAALAADGGTPAPLGTVLPLYRGTVTYHASVAGIPDFTRTLPMSGTAYFSSAYYADGAYYGRDGYALAGWATEENGPVAYEPGDAVPADVTAPEVWAVWVPICLAADEVFSFNNSGWYFEADGRTGYYMSEEDYRTMQLNLYKNFGLGPVPSPILSVVLATYPDWDWRGSCYGMSVVTALQHFGLLDVVKTQNAAALSDMESDDAMISLINYYQSQAATSWLTENKAYLPGSPMYATQLDLLYQTVKAGKLVLFTFYEDQPFITPGHTVLMTGAYERADGSRVLIAYDNNCPWDYDGYDFDSRFVISPDGKSFSYDGETPGAFNWTDDFSQFTSFSIQKDGKPHVWYLAYFAHILSFFRALAQTFRNLFRG